MLIFDPMKNVLSSLFLVFFLVACSQSNTTPIRNNIKKRITDLAKTEDDQPLPQTEAVKLTFILTNDIHGQLEADTDEAGKKVGGMAYLAGVIENLKKEKDYQSDAAGLFVLDSGDQFQGSLASNFNEGRAMFDTMNAIGYDAVVPGNHDYDFGPLGWLHDKVTPGKTGNNPREAIEALAKQAKFPLLSANTYLKNSLSTDADQKNDYTNAKRPDFVKPYVIVEKAGVKVALIGIDNHSTASMTIAENVSDLHFRDEVETYLEVRQALEGKADVFVLLIHNGDTKTSNEASEITRKINEKIPNGVHLVAAGHTHHKHNHDLNGVKVIQNGDKTKFYGKVDLFFDSKTRQVLTKETKSTEGISLVHTEAQKPSTKVTEIVNQALAEVNSLAARRLGEAKEEIFRDRNNESALGNILADTLRSATQADITLINSGGVRDNLPKGTITYSTLFNVLPISNLAVRTTLSWKTMKAALMKSIQTCGAYGALFLSGLKVQYDKTCDANANTDPHAKLIKVETSNGKILFDSKENKEVAESEILNVVTLDFLAAGGSGYKMLAESKITETLEISRELIANQLEKTMPNLENKTDGRYLNLSSKPVAASVH